MSVEDTFDIQALLARFANSFDLKDWDGLLACLAESLYTDYADLRGTAPETIPALDYVQARRAALQDLQTHHLNGNVEIKYIDPLNATCRVSTVIWRKSDSEAFDTHCVYTFKVTKIKYDWKINAITQKILWNEGQPNIHSGTQ
jgi:hypothetical protein